MSSKFNVRVSGCTGAVVVGDNAHLNVGAAATDGKCLKFAIFDHYCHGVTLGKTQKR